MSDFRDSIIPEIGSIAEVTTSVDNGTNLLDKVIFFVKDSIFGLLALISVGLFIYIGWKFMSANGNPEEMKKAFLTLVNVVIGLFVVAISWALIKIISGFNF